MQEFRRCFEKLKSDWVNERKKTVANERETAPRHNIMRLLELERAETRLHSRLLCDLLDPYGTHGQGASFLHEFLLLLQKKHADLQVSPDLDEVPAPGEWDVDTERENIDITIQNTRDDLLIFLENKIDADFQPHQLRRYRERLDRSGFSSRALVLLTPRDYDRGKLSKADADQVHVHLTYEDDIAPWLDRVKIKAPNVRLIVDQYCAVISSLNSVEETSMANVVELLLRPDNIECALEMKAAMLEVEERLKNRFWEEVEKGLVAGLRRYGLEQAWKTHRDELGSSDEPGIFVADQRHSEIVVGVWLRNPRSARVRVEVFHGIRIKTGQHHAVFDSPSVIRLCTELQRSAYTTLEHPWIAWKGNGCYPNWNRFLVEVARNEGDTAARAVVDAIDLLRTQGNQLVAVQEALVGTSRRG